MRAKKNAPADIFQELLELLWKNGLGPGGKGLGRRAEKKATSKKKMRKNGLDLSQICLTGRRYNYIGLRNRPWNVEDIVGGGRYTVS